MIKISGFDAITKKADQMAKFAEEIDGQLATVNFDPNDPASIEAVIKEVENIIDEKARSYERNDWVQKISEQLKEKMRETVLERAAIARTGPEDIQ